MFRVIGSFTITTLLWPNLAFCHCNDRLIDFTGLYTIDLTQHGQHGTFFINQRFLKTLVCTKSWPALLSKVKLSCDLTLKFLFAQCFFFGFFSA